MWVMVMGHKWLDSVASEPYAPSHLASPWEYLLINRYENKKKERDRWWLPVVALAREKAKLPNC